jgi:hypothetical protein
MKLDIAKVTVLLRDFQTDIVIVDTNLPSTMPGVTSDCAQLRTEAAKGSGIAYAALHFPGVELKVIDARSKKE